MVSGLTTAGAASASEGEEHVSGGGGEGDGEGDSERSDSPEYFVDLDCHSGRMTELGKQMTATYQCALLLEVRRKEQFVGERKERGKD